MARTTMAAALLVLLALGTALAETPELSSSEAGSRHLASTSELDAASAGELAELVSMLQAVANKKPSMHRNLLADAAAPGGGLDLQGIISLLQNVGNLIKPNGAAAGSQPQLNLSGLLTLLQNLGIKLPTPAGGAAGGNGLSLEGVMNFLQTIASLLPNANNANTTNAAADLPSAFINVLKSLGSLVTAVTTASNNGTTPELSPLLEFLQCVGQLFVQLAQNVNKAAKGA